VQSGVCVDISGFWQGHEVWSSDIYGQSLTYLGYRTPGALTEVSEKDHSKGHYDLQVSCLYQTSVGEMGWHVYARTVENSNFLEFPAWDVQAIATLLTLSQYSEGYGRDPCALRDLVCRSINIL
jgi:hypothetical protein